MNASSQPVLAAEDCESDAFILRLAFERARVANPLVIVRDGQEAVDYLLGNAPFSDRSKYPQPAIVMLDLKMPRMDGFGVLSWLATRRELKHLPVVVLSSSSAESDICKATVMGAQHYFVKPHAFADLVKVIDCMRTRWIETPTQPFLPETPILRKNGDQ